MQASLIVFIGGGIGSVLRHLVNVWTARLAGMDFPWGTFTVNVSGSLIMGVFAGYFAFMAGEAWSPHLRLLLMTGVLGGFSSLTAFSAFSLDAMLLWERSQPAVAFAYVIGSVVVSVAALVVGLAAVRAMS